MQRWWNSAKMLWRYGITGPLRTDSIVSKMLKNFITIYTPQKGRWESVDELVDLLRLQDATMNTADDYLASQRVSERFIDEMVDAATRANYGQVSVLKCIGLGRLVTIGVIDNWYATGCF